jgi:flagellar motor switch protein FliN/FliY
MSSDLTLDLSTLDGVRAAVQVAAAAAAATLPLPATVEELFEEQTAAALLPEDGPGRAVSVNVRGAATGTLVLVVAASLATALENSPFGKQELLAALGPALGDAAAALEAGSPAPLALEAAHEISPSIALSGVGDGRLFAAVPLTSGGEHLATLALVLEPVAAAAPELPAAAVPAQPEAVDARTHEFQALDGRGGGLGASRPLDLLHDVEMGVTAELGRTRMTVRDLLSLTPGSVVELDRAAGSPVDVLVNGTLIARGEVVVIDEEFGIRISEIIGTRPAATAPRR